MENHTLKLDLDNDRHLIIGDQHGRYDILMALLDKANYDPAKDILYSVGDMIDRGPDSVKMVEFFQQERCYAVKGNHELMMMDTEWSETWLNNGGLVCLTDLERNDRSHEWLKDIIRPLPWVIDVGDNDEEHAFRIVHAEHPPGWSESFFQRTLNDAINHDDTTFSRLLWSRKLIQAATVNINVLRPSAHGIEFHPERYRQVFTGHTPIHKAFKCGDHWFLDTWRSKSMTMIDAVTNEKFVQYYDTHTNKPI